MFSTVRTTYEVENSQNTSTLLSQASGIETSMLKNALYTGKMYIFKFHSVLSEISNFSITTFL